MEPLESSTMEAIRVRRTDLDFMMKF